MSSSIIHETCPLPSTQGQGVNFIPETCPINDNPRTTLRSVGTGSGSNSDLNNLLEAPVNEIPSTMVAPLLGSIYDNQTNETGSSSGRKNFSPPRSPTLESTGKRSVILIQPLGEDGRDLLYNPVLTNELLYDQSGIFCNKFVIKDLRINKIKGIIAVEYSSNVPWEFLRSLTAVECLGEYRVKTYIPNSDLFSAGTISPVSLKLSTEKIQQHLKIDQHWNMVKIIKIERLKKREPDATEVTDSETIKITFSSAEPPKGVTLCGSYYKTRLFIPFPVQCWKCQRLGHTSSSCKSLRARCRKCAGNHQKKDCTSSAMKCANCSGAHNANSRDCPIIREAFRLEKNKVLSKNSMSVSQPAPQISSGKNWPNLSTKMQGILKQSEPSSSRPLFSQVASDPNVKNVNSSSGMRPQCSCSCEETLNTLLDKKFFDKLKNFVLEIITMVSKGENSAAKSSLANNAIRNNFGVDLSDPGTLDKDNVAGEFTKKRPLTSTDEYLTDNDDVAGVVSDLDSTREKENQTSEEVEKKSVSKKNKKNKVKKRK